MPSSDKRIPDCAIEVIKKFYGCNLNAHPDLITGNAPYRIGYGSQFYEDGDTVLPEHDIPSEDEAEFLMLEEIADYHIPFLRGIPNWFDFHDGQRGALISFSWCYGPFFYGNKQFRAISSVLRRSKYDELEEVIKFYNKENSKVTKRMVQWRKAEIKLWNGLYPNSLENRVFIVHPEMEVTANKEFILTGICNPEWKGRGVNIAINGEKMHRIPERPLVLPSGRWECPATLPKGKHEVRITIDGYRKFIDIISIARQDY